MHLKPLEFSDCLLDSPYFRDCIHAHEADLDEANKSIKDLIKECSNLIKALKDLSKAQRGFSAQLNKFKIHISDTDVNDDLDYEDALPTFAVIIESIVGEMERMLDHTEIQLIDPLEKFRREKILYAKEEKKKFEGETDRICNLLDAHLKQSPKKKETSLMEMDAQLALEMRDFQHMSLNYVSLLQEVNERKKFEIIEILLSFMYGQSLFYYNGCEIFNYSKSYFTELQMKLQRTREHFDVTKEEVEELKNRTIKKFDRGEFHKALHDRQGYLYVNDKKRGVLGSTWTKKHYCMYKKENKILTMIPYTQTRGKPKTSIDTLVVKSCARKPTELSERRFLFAITGNDSPQPIQLQSLSEEDRRRWLEAMDGKEPTYQEPSDSHSNEAVTSINVIGMQFVEKCIEAIESRGLDDQGLYKKAGVSSKFNKLLITGLDSEQVDNLDLVSPETPYETYTITSALKRYFRNLSEPLLTFKYHDEFIKAIKLETKEQQVGMLKNLLPCLPENHLKILHRLMHHLQLVSQHSKKNLMEASNLGAVLSPILMRTEEETVATIMGIKYGSSVIECIIQNYNELFPGDVPVLTQTSTLLRPKPQMNSSSIDPLEEKTQVEPVPSPPLTEKPDRKARTIYSCIADNDTELSFSAGAIVTNVHSSNEDGWLIGTLNGITGLIPESYCEIID